jgi:hypothetical protein
MALKILDCARVLPGGGCKLILVGEPDEVLTTYEAHRRDRHHDVTEIESGREPVNQLQNVVFSMPNRAYIGDDFERVADDTIRIPGPGVMMQRFGENSATVTCACGSGSGTCEVLVFGGQAICSNGSCSNCAFKTTTTGFVADKTLPVFLTE